MLKLLPALCALALVSPSARADQPPPFTEVDPQHTSAAFKAYVAKGLDQLIKSGTALGLGTRRAIASGRVKLDEMDDLTRKDYLRVRKELLGTGPALDLDGFARLHDARTHAARALKKALDGYQWDDRIYLSLGLAPKLLSETLAHEVNHVLNHSEKHYRTAKDILREEYRAFSVEHLLHGEALTAAKCKALKAGIIRDYGLKGVTPASIPDKPDGIVVP